MFRARLDWLSIVCWRAVLKEKMAAPLLVTDAEKTDPPDERVERESPDTRLLPLLLLAWLGAMIGVDCGVDLGVDLAVVRELDRVRDTARALLGGNRAGCWPATPPNAGGNAGVRCAVAVVTPSNALSFRAARFLQYERSHRQKSARKITPAPTTMAASTVFDEDEEDELPVETLFPVSELSLQSLYESEPLLEDAE